MALVASGDAADVVEYFRDVNITDASKVLPHLYTWSYLYISIYIYTFIHTYI